MNVKPAIISTRPTRANDKKLTNKSRHLETVKSTAPDCTSIPVQLRCKGPPCSECGKCIGWYFTGDSTTRNWLRNWANWDDDDWMNYRNDRVSELFKNRDDPTCQERLIHFFRHGGFPHLRRDFDVCLCESNTGQ